MTERDPSLLVIAEVRGRRVAKLFRDSEAHALNYNIINHAPSYSPFVMVEMSSRSTAIVHCSAEALLLIFSNHIM